MKFHSFQCIALVLVIAISVMPAVFSHTAVLRYYDYKLLQMLYYYKFC